MKTLVPVLAVALWAATAGAQQFVPAGRDTLRGLPGLELIVEVAQPELVARGLDPERIRADVERRLRAAGITVYAAQMENPSPAKPYLYVHLNALELPGRTGYAVAAQVQLRQTVRSTVTESQIVNAMTWDSHNVVAVPPDGLAAVGEEIGLSVDRFVRDWKSTR